MQILLVEDDPEISRELRLRWQAKGWGVVVGETVRDAGRLAKGFPHDLVVLDLQLPDGDGLDWLRGWRLQHPSVPVLVLTARDRVADRVLGLQRGADDYLVKPFAAAELDARIEALMRRSANSTGARVQYGPLVWLRDEAQALANGEALDLNPREFEVLGLLVRRAPHLVPKRVIVDALAERNLDVSDSAAEVYVSRLRRKLSSCQLLIETVRGFGYRLLLNSGDTLP